MSDTVAKSSVDKLREIKSFVLRQGRLTPGQQKAFDSDWPKFGITYAKSFIDFAGLFGNNNPVILEIGFGNGDSLAQMAAENPALNYLGIEVHRPGVGHLLIEINRHELTNLRIISHDAIEVLRHCENYAAHITKTLDENSHFKLADNTTHAARRPKTKFENRGLKLGHKVADIVAVNC
jgi:tRNA G46 methylase TrmB